MRKKMKVTIFTVIILTIMMTANVFAAENLEMLYGDVNGDGSINLKDVVTLRRNLSGGWEDLTIFEQNCDVNEDGKIGLKDVVFLERCLAGGWGIELPENKPVPNPDDKLDDDLREFRLLTTSKNEKGIRTTSFAYGTSELGRELVCWCIEPEEYNRTVLLNFEIHGWEDGYAADGQLLVDLGNALVNNYSAAAEMYNCRLLIVPSSNPDGLAEGTTNNGFGRCNASGVDLNRDFDANHVVYTSGRNYTLSPFSANESSALRDLVLASNPVVVIDFHGWENNTIGNSDLAELFSLYTGLNHKCELTINAHGYFSYWAQKQGAEALLVEFKNPDSIVVSNVIMVIDKIIAGNYGDHQTDYELDKEFAPYDSIVCYALTSERVYTHQSVGDSGMNYGYIDGANDQCTVEQIYSNGWCKVKYPGSSGYTKTGYCEVSAFIDPDTKVSSYTANTADTATVYAKSDKRTKLGSVWNTDTFTVIAENEEMLQIVYPLDAGGYKMGWIEKSAIIE